MKLSEQHHADCMTRHGYPVECNCHVDVIIQLEAELATVLDVAIARGEKLGYADEDYRERIDAHKED